MSQTRSYYIYSVRTITGNIHKQTLNSNSVSLAVQYRHVTFIHSIRSPGSAAVNMCLVACGSADAYYHMGIHCWDMAGGAVIVTEAGGVIMDISGESQRKREPFKHQLLRSCWVTEGKEGSRKLKLVEKQQDCWRKFPHSKTGDWYFGANRTEVIRLGMIHSPFTQVVFVFVFFCHKCSWNTVKDGNRAASGFVILTGSSWVWETWS